MPFVYIVRCSDKSYYTGSTALDVALRVWEHNHDDARGGGTHATTTPCDARLVRAR
jgi:predicted GIY-YIG superfamily endonuclease